MFFDLFFCSPHSTLLTYHLHLARLRLWYYTPSDPSRNSNHKKRTMKIFWMITQAHDPWYLLSRFYLSATHSPTLERVVVGEILRKPTSHKRAREIVCKCVETGLSNIFIFLFSCFFYYTFSLRYSQDSRVSTHRPAWFSPFLSHRSCLDEVASFLSLPGQSSVVKSLRGVSFGSFFLGKINLKKRNWKNAAKTFAVPRVRHRDTSWSCGKREREGVWIYAEKSANLSWSED